MELTEVRQEVFPLDDGLHRLMQYDSNGTFVDSYLIIGSTQALAVDLQRAKGSLLAAIRELTDKPLTVVITHGHYDHLGANTREFVDNGIPVWISLAEYEAFRSEISTVLGDRSDPPFRFLTQGQNFDLGGYKLETGFLSGHTPRGCMLLERNKGWLFSGDALGNRSFYMQVPGASSLESFHKSLEEYLKTVRSVPNLKIFTGHGIGETYYGLSWAEQICALTGEIINGKRHGVYTLGRWGECLRLDTEIFPEGYLYQADRILDTHPEAERP